MEQVDKGRYKLPWNPKLVIFSPSKSNVFIIPCERQIHSVPLNSSVLNTFVLVEGKCHLFPRGSRLSEPFKIRIAFRSSVIDDIKSAADDTFERS